MSTKTIAKATAKYVRMSPSKVRRVLKHLKYLSYQEALIVLEFLGKMKNTIYQEQGFT